ncbi:MAG: hypothetical protein JW864_17095 [Spirochaetes bacterium]|nr:hypothetical protein [Spirochaetota bacterium]
MKFVSVVSMILIVALCVISCKNEPKVMTPEDFIKIENEVLNTDLTPESKEKIAEKYGFTLKQFEEFEERVEMDPELKKKVGEAQLNLQQ